MNAPRAKNSVSDDPLNWLDVVRQQVSSLQFGAVEIVVHDSRVVQIEKTERLRLGTDAGKPGRVTSLTATVAGPVQTAVPSVPGQLTA